MIGTTRLMLILLALATASTPALAYGWHHRHHYYGWHRFHGSYNYGGPHYSADDFYNNSRQLNGTR